MACTGGPQRSPRWHWDSQITNSNSMAYPGIVLIKLQDGYKAWFFFLGDYVSLSNGILYKWTEYFCMNCSHWRDRILCAKFQGKGCSFIDISLVFCGKKGAHYGRGSINILALLHWANCAITCEPTSGPNRSRAANLTKATWEYFCMIARLRT